MGRNSSIGATVGRGEKRKAKGLKRNSIKSLNFVYVCFSTLSLSLFLDIIKMTGEELELVEGYDKITAISEWWCGTWNG